MSLNKMPPRFEISANRRSHLAGSTTFQIGVMDFSGRWLKRLHYREANRLVYRAWKERLPGMLLILAGRMEYGKRVVWHGDRKHDQEAEVSKTEWIIPV